MKFDPETLRARFHEAKAEKEKLEAALAPKVVERDALLAGVELPEHGARAGAQRRTRAHHVAVRCLDFDHLRPEVGKQPRAMWPRDCRREIDHADVVERSAHRALVALPLCIAGSGRI